MINEHLLRSKPKQKICCFDVETESLSLYYSRPWQVSWLVRDMFNEYEVQNRYIFWKDLNVSEGAKRVSHFNEVLYKEKAEDSRLVLAQLEQLLYDDNIIKIGHNILNFDTYQLTTWRRELGLKPDYSWLKQLRDTNAIEKAIQCQIVPDLDNILTWQYKCISIRKKGLKTSLSTSCKRRGIEPDEALLHDAGYDVKINSQLFYKQIHEIEI